VDGGWVVLNFESRTEHHYPTLADAVNAVLARLQAWQAEHPTDNA
jgi:hypothetical protein